MKKNPLGKTDLAVSELCLGTMTWGTQNSEAEAHQQMDYAVDQGINIFDTAEMYPTTPKSEETQGRTEDIIGTWFQRTGKREKVILATKVTGKGPTWIQNGRSLSAQKIRQSLDESLERLRTDYIDLYQLHWPNRNTYHFRQSWGYNPTVQNVERTRDDISEILRELEKQVKAGKIRHVGLSNETCWGTSQYLEIAKTAGLPRMVSIQNEYSLLHRLFDLDLAELSHNEQVGLLAFSPLAAGLLSGKYNGGETPPGSRMSMDQDLGGRKNPYSETALQKYLDVARRHGINPAQMALSFCTSRPFMTSVIIGATSMEQLKINIGAAQLSLSEAVMQDIENVYREHPIPM